eukprot:CAMPEP_0197862904 /NCGR_PEP_ID=MMETSP1438-20131217/39999_1 /TAXON_ID=1461541 /ORGANISM="Pterosperma sp., Strain CCMP1384" /LENGTH=316 /DNA_ID=CAMNT_0043480621 /DNA_START=102 /DNA_END=1052 /DNA_ORIENTATION=-
MSPVGTNTVSITSAGNRVRRPVLASAASPSIAGLLTARKTSSHKQPFRPSYRPTVSRGLRRSSSLSTTMSALAVGPKDDLISKLSKQLNPTEGDRMAVGEFLPLLEASNPTKSPTFSPLLQGEWEVLYSGGITPGPVPSPTRGIALLMYAGGFTPGMFALELARFLPDNVLKADSLTLTISSSTVEAVSKISALGRDQEVTLMTSIAPESETRLKETYTGLKAAGRSVDLPESAKFQRTLFITYLDENLLVARDETGAPDILMKKSPVDSVSTEAVEEATAPAAASAPATGSTVDVEVVTEDDEDKSYLDDISETM